MSLIDYKTARRIIVDDPTFAALLMAALMKADSHNAMLLRACWPDICTEAQDRYDAPGGVLPGELQPEGPVGTLPA